jgi:hypothetical protein
LTDDRIPIPNIPVFSETSPLSLRPKRSFSEAGLTLEAQSNPRIAHTVQQEDSIELPEPEEDSVDEEAILRPNTGPSRQQIPPKRSRKGKAKAPIIPKTNGSKSRLLLVNIVFVHV